MAPAAAYAELVANGLGDSDATYTVSSNKGDGQIVLGILENNVLRNPHITRLASGIYLKGDTENSVLNITVSGGHQTASSGGWPPLNQTQIMGSVLTVRSSGDQSAAGTLADYRKLINGVPTDKYSTTASGSTVNLTLEENAEFYTVIYGGRSDISAGTDTPDYDTVGKIIGDACYNTVNINIKKGATLGASLIFGGRSAQAEGALLENNPFNVNLHQGYKTDYNTVIVRGTQEDYAAKNINMNFPAGGIFGGEGWQSNHNYVYLDYVNACSPSKASRDFGIVGGRGLYNFRIYDKEDSAHANDNVVIVRNSNIATDATSLAGQTIGGKHYNGGMSIYGGFSYGQAMNNVVALENSVINGNVFGGMELMGETRVENDPVTGKPHRRELHSNVVSLYNTTLIGNSSIYGTATADSKRWWEAVRDGDRAPTDKEGYYSSNAVDEQSLKNVNRRRGIAYIGGAVTSASAYVRFIHFGSYVDANRLYGHANYNVFNKYYPSADNAGNDGGPTLPIINTSGSEAITLNQLVAGSYINNTKGFHSYLSKQDETQSHSTNPLDPTDANGDGDSEGRHNYWVAAYANLQSLVNGDGTNLNTTHRFYSDGSDVVGKEGNGGQNVNHKYTTDGKGATDATQGDLSLLAMDDGMVLNDAYKLDNNNNIMHQFRNYYQGRVLYLGIHNGKDVTETNDINSVLIAFEKIDEFRKDNNQGVNAYGNTRIGIFVDGHGADAEGNPYQKAPVPEGYEQEWNDMVISVPNFEIKQSNQLGQPVTVADATFGFYKYLHFDGKLVDSVDVPYWGGEYSTSADSIEYIKGGDIKVSEQGVPSGVGFKYWLKSVTVRPGATLMLNGKTAVSVFDVSATDDQKRSTYTLSAYLTGEGNIAAAKNSKVILGDGDVPEDTIKTQIYSGTGWTAQEKIGENQFTGDTFVLEGAELIQGTDGALGSETVHTANLNLMENNARYSLQGHKQLVGGLFVNGSAGSESIVNLSDKAADIHDPNGKTVGDTNGGLLRVNNYALIGKDGRIEGRANSCLAIENSFADVFSANANMEGTFALASSIGNLHNENAFMNGFVSVDGLSRLNFLSAARSNTIGGVYNAGHIYLSDSSRYEDENSLHEVNINTSSSAGGAYIGAEGSVLHYRGFIQGEGNRILGHASSSYVDVIRANTAAGSSRVLFGESFDTPYSGIFSPARGDRVVKENGIPLFIIANRNVPGGDPLELTMDPIAVVAKQDEGYEWIYSLGYNDIADSTERDWVLYNSVDGKDAYFPRPEPGAYVAAALSWSRMHMRLHDRFGQAYETDPFDAAHKPQSAWIRQEGRRSVFGMSDGLTNTKSLTTLTQLGGDVIRKELDDVWKYTLGFFTGDLYNRSKSHTWNTAKSRSNGYGLGVYGTLYTGNSPDDGFYVDSWLMYNHYDNKIYGHRPAFYYNASGWVASVESGLTLPLGETGEKGKHKTIWTVQPEVQVIWDGVEAHRAVDSVGTPYTQLGTDNVVIRAGARLHANAMNKGLGYIEANWIHNTHELGVMLGDSPTYMEGGRDLGELRMGLEGRLSEDGNCLGWMTVGTQQGRHHYHNDMVQVGLRYMF